MKDFNVEEHIDDLQMSIDELKKISDFFSTLIEIHKRLNKTPCLDEKIECIRD